MNTCPSTEAVANTDSASFRDALAHFGTGVTVVTTRDEMGAVWRSRLLKR